jgi:hypothetical protein
MGSMRTANDNYGQETIMKQCICLYLSAPACPKSLFPQGVSSPPNKEVQRAVKCSRPIHVS